MKSTKPKVFKLSGAPRPEPEAVTQADVDEAAAQAEVSHEALRVNRENMDTYKAEMRAKMEAESAELQALSGLDLISRFTPSDADVDAGVDEALKGTGLTAEKVNRYLGMTPSEIADTLSMSEMSNLAKTFNIQAGLAQIVEAMEQAQAALAEIKQQIAEQLASEKRDARVAELPGEYLLYPNGKVFTDPESPFPQLEDARASFQEAKDQLEAIKKKLETYQAYQAKVQVMTWSEAITEISREIREKKGELSETEAKLAQLTKAAQSAFDLVHFAEANIQELEKKFDEYKKEMETELAEETARVEALEGEALLEEFPVSDEELDTAVEAYFRSEPYVLFVGRMTYEDYQAYEAGNMGAIQGGEYRVEGGGINQSDVAILQRSMTAVKDLIRERLAGRLRDEDIAWRRDDTTERITEMEALNGERRAQMERSKDVLQERAAQKTEMAHDVEADRDQYQQELADLEAELTTPGDERLERKREEVVKRMRGGDDEEGDDRVASL